MLIKNKIAPIATAKSHFCGRCTRMEFCNCKFRLCWRGIL